MQYSDRELVCASCSQPFVFSGGEQAYYAQNALQDPRRCKPCRAQRKADGGGGSEKRRGGGGGNGNAHGGNQGPRRHGGPRQPAVFRPAAADDPNGYRAPGFQSESRPAYAIDYAGLPRDEEDEADGQAAMLGPRDGGGDRFGMRTSNAAAPGAQGRGPRGGNHHGAPRGMNGRRMDRSGTDPNAYRSPGFAPQPRPGARGNELRTNAPSDAPPADGVEASGEAAPGNRRSRRAQRARHEALCADCGAQALVPFEPGPDRPAYCKPCYQVRKANGTVPLPPPSAGAPRTSDVTALDPSAASESPAPVSSDNAGE